MKILDLSAGPRGIWFDKQHQDTVFVDLRPETKPTIVADSRMLPFATGVNFDLVVFDPPHVNFGETAELSKTYGWFNTETIRDTIKRTAGEAYRVTRIDALMAFKWNDHDQKLEKVLALMHEWWEPLFGQKTSTRTKHASTTCWVLLKRKEIVE